MITVGTITNSMELSPREAKSQVVKLLINAIFMCYCVFYGNATDNVWLLDLMPQFIGYLPGRITFHYNTPNIMHKSGHLITCQSFTG
jgi:hypothetical protein